jgi:hypothetical protein
MGPGLNAMASREHLYPELAKHCDIWMIQTQRLQLDPQTATPVGPERYRDEVKGAEMGSGLISTARIRTARMVSACVTTCAWSGQQIGSVELDGLGQVRDGHRQRIADEPPSQRPLPMVEIA